MQSNHATNYAITPSTSETIQQSSPSLPLSNSSSFTSTHFVTPRPYLSSSTSSSSLSNCSPPTIISNSDRHLGSSNAATSNVAQNIPTTNSSEINSAPRHVSRDYTISNLQIYFDETVLNTERSTDFLLLYQDMKIHNEHLGTLILNRMRKWLGECGYLDDELARCNKKKLTDENIQEIFSSIDKISSYYLIHFRQMLSFTKWKLPKNISPALTWSTHRFAMIAQGVVHPAVKDLLTEIHLVKHQNGTSSLWRIVEDKITELSLQFTNIFTEPTLQGINPTLGASFRSRDNVPLQHRVYFAVNYMDLILRSYFQECHDYTNLIPDDYWVSAKITTLLHPADRPIMHYFWLTWKNYFLIREYSWLTCGKLEVLQNKLAKAFPTTTTATQNHSTSSVEMIQYGGDGPSSLLTQPSQPPPPLPSIPSLPSTSLSLLLSSSSSPSGSNFNHVPTISRTVSTRESSYNDSNHTITPIHSISELCSVSPPSSSSSSSSSTLPLPPPPTSSSSLPLPSSTTSTTSSSPPPLPPPLPHSTSPTPVHPPPASPPPPLPTQPLPSLPPLRPLPSHPSFTTTTSSFSALPSSMLLSDQSSNSINSFEGKSNYDDDNHFSLNHDQDIGFEYTNDMSHPLPPPPPRHVVVAAAEDQYPFQYQTSQRASQLRSNYISNHTSSTSSTSRVSSSHTDIELMKAKAQYYRLKNARKVLKDMKKGVLDHTMYTRDEIRDLRKRCYEAMIN